MPQTGPVFFQINGRISFGQTYVMTDFQGVSQAVSAHKETTVLDLSQMRLWGIHSRYRGSLMALLSTTSITSLDLSGNNLGLVRDSIQFLLEGIDASNIRALQLGHNALEKLNTAQLRQLSERLLQSKINELDLSHNHLAKLLSSPHFLTLDGGSKSNLLKLNLCGNGMWRLSLKEFEALILRLPKSINSINLSSNALGQIASPHKIAAVLSKIKADIVLNDDNSSEAILEQLRAIRSGCSSDDEEQAASRCFGFWR